MMPPGPSAHEAVATGKSVREVALLKTGLTSEQLEKSSGALEHDHARTRKALTQRVQSNFVSVISRG